jgi:hypothetical protein
MLKTADQLARLGHGVEIGDHPLGDVLSQITDPLEVGGDPDRTDDLAQIRLRSAGAWR